MLLASATEAPPAGDHAVFNPVGCKAVRNTLEIPSHEEDSRRGRSSFIPRVPWKNRRSWRYFHPEL